VSRRALTALTLLSLLSCKHGDVALAAGVVGAVLGTGNGDYDKIVAKSEECQRVEKFDIPLKEEVSVGGAVAVNLVKAGGGLVVGTAPKDELTLYINRVGRNLAMQSARPYLDWTFGVLDSDEFNAISTPGGYVFITRGLLRAVKNEAQLAGVLGHEIAHVTKKHAVNSYRKAKAESCDRAVYMMAGSSMAKSWAVHADRNSKEPTGLDFDDLQNTDLLVELANGAVTEIATRGYSQDREHEADRVGLRLALRAGYNPHEYVNFLGTVQQDFIAWRNHPSNADRQAKLTAYLQTLKDDPFFPDWPFKKLPAVPLTNELAAAR
jgi:predicted Zn-dependent protease